MAKKAVKPEEAAGVESPAVAPVLLDVSAVLNSKKFCRLVPRFVLAAKLHGKAQVSEDELNQIVSDYVERR